MNGWSPRRNVLFDVPTTGERAADAVCLVIATVFLLYIGGHVLWSVIR